MSKMLSININSIEREIRSQIEMETDPNKKQNKLDALEVSIATIRKYNDELEYEVEKIFEKMTAGLGRI